MGQIATSIDEQIEKLRNRGMIFDFEKTKVKEILLDIGYYRLGFYWKPFEIDKEHNFRKETSFSDIIALYYLDVELRDLLSQYLGRIELNFRTKLIYYVSNKYKNSPTWFVDSSVVKPKFINKFDTFYTVSFKQKNKALAKHHKKYINDKYAPAWKTIEFLTFANIVHLFDAIKDNNVKQLISNEFKVNDVSKFKNLLDTMVFLRNVCAHNSVLYDIQTPKGISKLPLFTFNNNDRHSLQASIEVVKFLLNSISVNRTKEFKERLNKLINNHNYSENIKKK